MNQIKIRIITDDKSGEKIADIDEAAAIYLSQDMTHYCKSHTFVMATHCKYSGYPAEINGLLCKICCLFIPQDEIVEITEKESTDGG